MIKVGRAINGIGLNGREWLLNEDNSLMEFKDKAEAIELISIREEVEIYGNN